MGKMILKPSQPSQKSEGSGPSSKVPCAADLADAASIGSTKSEVKKENRIHIYEVIYCDDGSVYGDIFEGEMIALHLGHEFRNVWYLFIRSLQSYCTFRRSKEEDFPETLQELSNALKIKIINTIPPNGKTKISDEDEIGTFVKNRIAVYCDRSNLKNICCFLDGFVAWRVLNPLGTGERRWEQNPKITIHIQDDSELAFDSEDGMECEIDVIKDMDATEVTAFQAYPPVFPPRFVIATVRAKPESESVISIVFSGNTFPFAGEFDALHIGRKALPKEESSYVEWYRCLGEVDVSIDEKRDLLLSIFGKGVLKNSPCFLNVESCPKEDSDWKTFLSEVSNYRNVIVRE